MNDTIKDVLQEYGRLGVPAADLADDADLYQAGMSSHASVNVMLALEDEFDIEFPDTLLTRETFGSISSIRGVLTQLGAAKG